MHNFFSGLFDSPFTSVIAPGQFLLCVAVSLIIGFILMAMTLWHAKSSESFALTLALLPAAVCVVIMMVNGNVGTGVAVAGAFSLVRFRSVAGTAREICAIFIAMAAGLLAGMGYLAYAALFSLIMGSMIMLCTALKIGSKNHTAYRKLHITIPENLDYDGVFDSVFRKYTSRYALRNVKSTNMGSLFKLTYDLTLLPDAPEKAMLDELRCRNGNLDISMSYQDTDNPGL